MAESEDAPVPKQAAPRSGGAWLVWLTVAGTAVFTVVTVLGVLVRSVRLVAAGVDSVLFVVGLVAFLVAIVASGSRALRGVGIRASGLYLAAFATPRDRTLFRSCLGVTSVLGLGAALLVSGSADPGPYVLTVPAMAYGILVPIFPPALAGVHGAVYCDWPKRSATS